MQHREYESEGLPPIEQTTELASPWARLAAVIIDGLIVGVPTLVFILLGIISGSSEDDPSTGLIWAGAAVFIILFVIQMVLLGTRGQTIGKIALRIRIVDAQSGAHPGWARLILLRAILNGILAGIPAVGWIYLLVDSLFIFRGDHRTVHDLYSGTRVDKL